MTQRTRTAGLLSILALLSACSSAKRPAPAESASMGDDSAGRAGAATLVRPGTLPASEPSMRHEMPVVRAPDRDTTGADRAAIVRLEREARAIAHTSGCSTAGACRTAPVGVKACGGPRTWIVYCAATTDTVALARTLRALERAERAWNARSGMMSTCEMQMPPSPALVGGSCREAP